MKRVVRAGRVIVVVPPAQYGNGCRGKKGYPSRRQALGAMRTSGIWMRREGRAPDLLNVYKCSACHRWHQGHRIPRRGSHGEENNEGGE